MATLYKHGTEIGRIEYLDCVVAIMSDGKLLRNQGDGWKQWRKCKPDKTPQEVFELRQRKSEESKVSAPAYWDYKRALHAEFPLKLRALAHFTIDSMPQDPDGVWSEINDMLGHSVDFDTVQELCGLWLAVESERKGRVQSTETVAA